MRADHFHSPCCFHFCAPLCLAAAPAAGGGWHGAKTHKIYDGVMLDYPRCANHGETTKWGRATRDRQEVSNHGGDEGFSCYLRVLARLPSPPLRSQPDLFVYLGHGGFLPPRDGPGIHREARHCEREVVLRECMALSRGMDRRETSVSCISVFLFQYDMVTRIGLALFPAVHTDVPRWV